MCFLVAWIRMSMWKTCMLCEKPLGSSCYIVCIPGKSNISSTSTDSLLPIPWAPFSSSSNLSLSASASFRRCFSWDS